MKRSAGILLPIFSLPSEYGIGSLGAEARAFANFLQDAGQSWWQILPVGPAGAGDSPYASESTFAGNPLFIDLDLLAKDGLLTEEELSSARVPAGDKIDYGALKKSREPLLRKAFSRVSGETAEAARAFAEQNPWVREYALYRAVKGHFGGLAWFDWPDEGLRRHEGEAVDRWRVELAEEAASIPPEQTEVLDAVLALPAKYKDTIYLHYYEGYSAGEIGKILGKKENTVYSLLSRGRTMLKKALGGDL